MAQSLEVLRVSYAPPKNQTKRWPTEAQMEGWFPRSCGEHTRHRIALQWDRPRTESSDRATRNGSAAAQAEPREQRLNSRPSSWNGSRRPDRRICGDGGSTSCAPTLWKEKETAFSAMSDNRPWAQAVNATLSRNFSAGERYCNVFRGRWLSRRATLSSAASVRIQRSTRTAEEAHTVERASSRNSPPGSCFDSARFFRRFPRRYSLQLIV